MSSQKRLFFLCVCIFLCVLGIFGVMWLRRPAPVPVFDPVAAHASWKELIGQDILPLSSSSTSEEIRQAREALLQLTVTSEDREAHLALVMALVAWEKGQAGGYEKVHQAAIDTQK